MSVLQLTPEQAQALVVARALAAAGVPVFVAAPDPASSTGFRLPSNWQQTRPDPAAVDAWRPGMALAVVMGQGLDLLDVDPRSGGDLSSLNGSTPASYGAAVTPSGGVHSFIRSLGVRSRDNVLPGIDVKAGDATGKGRGFAFIAPTVRVSKVTGQPTAYRWASAPDLTRLAAVLRGEVPDETGAALRALIDQARGAGSGRKPVEPAGMVAEGIPMGSQDVELSRLVMKLRSEGFGREAALAVWTTAVDKSPSDPSRPWTPADFERHWSGADRKVTAAEQHEAQAWEQLGFTPQAATQRAAAPPRGGGGGQAGTDSDGGAEEPQGQPQRPPSSEEIAARYFGPGGIQAATLAGDVLSLGPLRTGVDHVMWSYAGGVWGSEKKVVEQRLARLLGQRFRSSYTGTVEAMVRAYVDTITCDPVPELINFGNGLLDWRTGELRPHSPEVPTTVQLAVDYDPDAQCPAFEEFVAQVVPQDMVTTVWELIGYLMYSGNPLHKAVMLTGTGRNGKGTFLHAVESLLGSRNYTSVSLHDLVNTRFTTASLFGKLANIAGDIDAGYIENTATFKAITGGDTISAEHKGRDRFDFRPWAVPLFSANKIPASADTTIGYLSRWLVVPFPHDFTGREDRWLADRLQRPEELRGIAARGISVLGRLLARGDFEVTASGQAAREEFIKRVDQVHTWLAECCSIAPDHPFVPRTELYQAYKQWAFRDGHKPVRASEFYERLEQAGGEPVIVMGTRGFKRIKVLDHGLMGPQPGGPWNPQGAEGAGKSNSSKPADDLGAEAPEAADRGAPEASDPAQGADSTGVPAPSVSAGQRRNSTGLGAVGAGNPQPPYARVRVMGGYVEPAPAAPNLNKALFRGEGHDLGHGRTDLKALRQSATDVAREKLPSDGSADDLPPVPDTPAAGVTVFDLETASADELCTYGPGYIRLGGYTHAGEVRLTADADRLTRYLEQADLVAGHNILGFDLLAMTRYHGLDVHAMVERGAVFDTLLAARQLDPPRARANQKYDLDTLAGRMGLPGKSFDLKKLAKEFGGYDRIPLDDPRYREYLERDVSVSLGVYARTATRDPYIAREHRVAAVTGQITLNGFAVDRELLDERLADVAQTKGDALAELEEAYEIPMTSAKGVRYKSPLATDAGKAALEEAFTRLGVTELPRTPKTGALTTGGEEMAALARRYPQAARLCELVKTVTGARTIYGTIDAHTVQTSDGRWRVFPTISMEQSTGRASTTKPGLTVVGKRGERYHERDVFVADPGEVMLSVDLAQVDARAVAALSGDPAYREMFAPGRDLHAEVAERVWRDRSRREHAKAIGHGWNYGMGLGRLAAEAEVDYLAAQQFDAAMRYQFPRLVEWRDEVRTLAAAGFLLDNGFGRKMNPDPERAHTQGPAFMGQGAARDLMMEGLLRLPRKIYPMLRAIVHDEVVLSVPADIALDVAHAVTSAMSFEWRGVPIIAEPQKTRDGQVRFGRTWGDLYAKDAA